MLLVVLAGGRIQAADGDGVLRLATCQFPVSADVRANGNWVRTQMRQASDQGAELIHFSVRLSGYAGVDLPSMRTWTGMPSTRRPRRSCRWPVS